MNLPPAIIGAYTNRALAKKVNVGFDSLQSVQGAQAPISSVLFLFVAPEVSPFGSVRGETFGSAGYALYDRSVNPAYTAANLFDSELWQWWFNQYKVTIMPILIVQDGATLPELASQAHTTSIHCRHLSALINNMVEDQDDFQNPQHFQRVAALCGLLASVLDQHKLVCEELEYAAQEFGI